MKIRNQKSEKVFSIVGLLLSGISIHLWGAENVLDTKIFYTAAQAETFFHILTPSELQVYLLNEALDLVFIFSYSLLFFSLARQFNFVTAWPALIPGALDLLETTTIILVLLNRTLSPPVWLGYVTCLKWITGGIGVIGICLKLAISKTTARFTNDNIEPITCQKY